MGRIVTLSVPPPTAITGFTNFLSADGVGQRTVSFTRLTGCDQNAKLAVRSLTYFGYSVTDAAALAVVTTPQAGLDMGSYTGLPTDGKVIAAGAYTGFNSVTPSVGWTFKPDVVVDAGDCPWGHLYGLQPPNLITMQLEIL